MKKQTLLPLAKFVKKPSKVAVQQHRKLGQANRRKTAAYRFDKLQQKWKKRDDDKQEDERKLVEGGKAWDDWHDKKGVEPTEEFSNGKLLYKAFGSPPKCSNGHSGDHGDEDDEDDIPVPDGAVWSDQEEDNNQHSSILKDTPEDLLQWTSAQWDAFYELNRRRTREAIAEEEAAKAALSK